MFFVFILVKKAEINSTSPLLGAPTAVFGVVLFFVLADDPETAWYLKEDEKKLLIARLHRQTGFHAEFNKEDAILAVKDWKTWFFAVGQFTVNAMLYSYSVFLPTIIKGISRRPILPFSSYSQN